MRGGEGEGSTDNFQGPRGSPGVRILSEPLEGPSEGKGGRFCGPEEFLSSFSLLLSSSFFFFFFFFSDELSACSAFVEGSRLSFILGKRGT